MSLVPQPDAVLAGEAAGWYGKLPSLGDFASRRLSPGFIEAWDGWLADCLADWRRREPQTWLDGYLTGSSWRFVLMPGVLPELPDAWVGVLMPSVDNVGRYFPLTLAQALPCLPEAPARLEALLGWLQQLDDLAVDALHDDWHIDQLEAELQRLGSWQASATQAHVPAEPISMAQFAQPVLELWPAAGVASLLADMAREQLLSLLQGKALWLRTDAQGRPVLRITRGLPHGEDFSDMLMCVDSAIPSTTCPY